MNSSNPSAWRRGLKLFLHDLGLNPEAILRRAALPGDLFVGDKSTLSFQRDWNYQYDIAEAAISFFYNSHRGGTTRLSSCWSSDPPHKR